MSENENIIDFNLPKNQSSVIKVIGVGGGGGNAINYMYENGIEGVDFAICNTDTQALEASPIPVKIQLGESLTGGLGAGSNPEVGKQAAIESIDRINELLDANTNMLFITAGMGGGTGTGAAPIIAQAAKEKGILTVGVITMPFNTEGGRRKEHAKKGVEELRNCVDTLLVINNEKLIQVYGDLKLREAFSKANEVLNTATKGIAEVITQYLSINIDLSDARLVLQDSGTAIMGQAFAEGENRAVEAVKQALDSPLLNDNDIYGSKHVLLKIVTGEDDNEISMNELKIINDTIQKAAGVNVNIIVGVGSDESLGSRLSVTIIATGFKANEEPEERKVSLGDEIEERLDETNDIIRKEEDNTSIDDDFSQQTMFKFDKDHYKDSLDYISEIKNQEEIVSSDRSSAVKDVIIEDSAHDSLSKKVVLELDEDSENLDSIIEADLEKREDLQDDGNISSLEADLERQEDLQDDSNISLLETENKEENVLLEESTSLEKEEHEIAARKRDERLRTISNILKTPSGLTNLIEEPAYKRDGIDLDETSHSSESEISNQTLSLGDDTITQIKTNNSFLHDNVD